MSVARRARSSGRPSLDVEVVWGDVTRTEGHVHLVGHYIGVLPQNAEKQLDIALSTPEGGVTRRLLLTELTRRGALRGELGEVLFFPWNRNRIVAVAGMGGLGTFREAELRIMARSVATTVGLLPERRSLNSVLIGSGQGNLDVRSCVREFLGGVIDALTRDPTLTLERVRFVELQLDKASEILQAAKATRDEHATRKTARLDVAARLKKKPGGRIPVDFGCSMLLANLARGSARPSNVTLRRALDTVLNELPEESPDLREQVRERLGSILRATVRRRSGSTAARLRDIAMSFRLREPDGQQPQQIPTRMAFWQDGDDLRASAITDTTTVVEREITRRVNLVNRAVTKLQNPAGADVPAFGAELMRLLVPQDLRQLLGKGGPLVVEVDRPLSRVQWEFLPTGQTGEPLGLYRPIARQLRTQYTVRPFDLVRASALHVLVIGDPGDPAIGHDLPAARTEALEVYKLFRSHGLDTTLLLGAPDPITQAGRYGHPPAEFSTVVNYLLGGKFDIVHYSGHALFDESAASSSGWLFTDHRVLTSHELDGMDRPPRLVVANACLSSQLAQTAAGRTPGDARMRGDAYLVAGLADEFFRRGVADYVGTAWEVPSTPAVKFAVTLYEELLGRGAHSRPLTFGAALQAARSALYKEAKKRKWGSVWGAYQHYGDPTRLLNPEAEARRARG